MRSIFGWSYPPGCSGPPEDNEPVVLRCSKGHFLPAKPIRSEPWEASTECKGVALEGGDECLCGKVGAHAPHKVVWDNGVHDVYFCKKCRAEVKLP
jgi:hypothetical protein